MPEDLRVAEVATGARQYGVALILGECTTVIEAVCDALLLAFQRFRAIAGCVDCNHCIFAEACGVVLVYYGAARIYRTERVGVDSRRQLLPLGQILAYSVSPRHIAPASAEWVVLEEEVPLALVPHHSVRVVGPSDLRREVDMLAVIFDFGVGILAEFEIFPRHVFGFASRNLDLRCLLVEMERHPTLNLLVGEAYGYGCGKERTAIDKHRNLFGRVVYREPESLLASLVEIYGRRRFTNIEHKSLTIYRCRD